MKGSLALAMLVATPPAAADVKAGLDAWNHGEWARAIAEWRPLAIQGDADAQFNLAQAYKFGRGVPVDLNQALAWFKRAADQGHRQAEDSYGIALFQSNRKPEAFPYLDRSARRGEPRAQLLLATMLFNGDGAAIDYPRAYALMTRASLAKMPSAAQSLSQMEAFLTPADRERGLQLVETYPALAGTAAKVAAAPTSAPAPPLAARQPAAPRQAAPPRPAPSPRAVQARPAPPRASTASGPWRVQLGAFRDRANADALWKKVGARVGGEPAYVAGGGVTRLQATGFPDRAAARRACAAAGVSCVVIAP
ncbi:Sel1 repeat-containing protein [Sphingomonas rubra]|uniref:Sel1 repeat-containing protein n=2 Tax=Sphingomonas rubra TaxID=634430 RepID=A0A1I5QUK4_9SPHN|nr:Sel1 repeat-containing protein [Sphingomonas rubra]